MWVGNNLITGYLLLKVLLEFFALRLIRSLVVLRRFPKYSHGPLLRGIVHTIGTGGIPSLPLSTINDSAALGDMALPGTC